jgi:hypothetical protein
MEKGIQIDHEGGRRFVTLMLDNQADRGAFARHLTQCGFNSPQPVFIRGTAPVWAVAMVAHAARGCMAVAVHDDELDGYVVISNLSPLYEVGEVVSLTQILPLA